MPGSLVFVENLVKLDPVYLVAPEPQTPGPTRRALLGWICGSAACAGGLGFALGRGWSTAAPTPSERDTDHVDPAPVSHLAWARDLAEGPAEDIYANATGFLTELHLHPDDDVLWFGVTQLGRYVVERPELERASSIATNILTYLDRIRPPRTADLEAIRPRLQRIAGR